MNAALAEFGLEPWIALTDPDITQAELDAATATLSSPRLSQGPRVEAFEETFARYAGRKHAVAVSSGTAGLLLALKAFGIGEGDEVLAAAYSWRETAHAITLCGAAPVFVDIDYWAGVLAPAKLAERITPATKAILAGNTNGHPAPWNALRELASRHGLILLEDSTEAIGSIYQGRIVGSFGDCAVFDFSQPAPLCCGEGGIVVTDDADIARNLRSSRSHAPTERGSHCVSARAPYQAAMSELAAAVALVQLSRIDEILEERRIIEGVYFEHIKSFEGIKDPYVAPEVDAAHWLLYLVHLGTRFSKSACDAIIEDLRRERIDAYAFCRPLHTQRHYVERNPANARGKLLVTEKLADRAVALPFHRHLSEQQIAFIVSTLKDASTNVGAGAAIF
ncbi:MAG: DegT/DnrJ/EryC1/StrS family aminotransferase [Steroidobacteraceae bacterium]|jgi:dTDP-4-amino-4,6-dideoxygalactose transaminase